MSSTVLARLPSDDKDSCFRPSGFLWDNELGPPLAARPGKEVSQMGLKTPSGDQMTEQARTSQTLIDQVWTEGKSIHWIIATDKSAVSMHTPETKQQSMQWLEKESPGPWRQRSCHQDQDSGSGIFSLSGCSVHHYGTSPKAKLWTPSMSSKSFRNSWGSRKGPNWSLGSGFCTWIMLWFFQPTGGGVPGTCFTITLKFDAKHERQPRILKCTHSTHNTITYTHRWVPYSLER